MNSSYSNFIAALALAQSIRCRESDEADVEAIKTGIVKLITEATEWSKKEEKPPREFDNSRYFVVTAIDEFLIASEWKGRGYWKRNTLQQYFYNRVTGGNEFFERLAKTETTWNEKDIAWLCLRLGFKGKYCDEASESTLIRVMDSIRPPLGTEKETGREYDPRSWKTKQVKYGVIIGGIIALLLTHLLFLKYLENL